MRGVLTKILVLLGAFLLATAALAMFWVPGQVKKTPLNVDSVTRLSGTAQLFDGTSLVETRSRRPARPRPTHRHRPVMSSSSRTSNVSSRIPLATLRTAWTPTTPTSAS